ncbi:MAG: hypothetical protein GY760_22385 [Deltaproteobacteria bacterium]|jgi:hypothetical protein|nr:hypothetical protein [Deltaproteobacteria bacterium]
MSDDKKKKKRTVKKNYVKDAKSKKVVKTTKRGTTTKERVSQYNQGYLGHKPADIPYGDKKLWEKRFKSKTDKAGKEKMRREKIVFDDGNQMTKRTQRKVRFGPNKGKIKSKTVNYNRGKKTVTKKYRTSTNKNKL